MGSTVRFASLALGMAALMAALRILPRLTGFTVGPLTTVLVALLCQIAAGVATGLMSEAVQDQHCRRQVFRRSLAVAVLPLLGPLLGFILAPLWLIFFLTPVVAALWLVVLLARMRHWKLLWAGSVALTAALSGTAAWLWLMSDLSDL
jgi:hypothetical protein